jgi:hypothetical protein
MRHPFEGVMDAEVARPRATRRTALGRMLGAVAALFGTAAAACAQPPRRPTTLALGEEGGRPTTLAVGEEGGVRPLGPGRPTTLAVGAEGGTVTTSALGAEGGTRPQMRPPGRPTTFALGEEGGRR